MDGDRAEVAFAVAAAVGADGKRIVSSALHLTLLFIIRVLGALKRQCIHRIHFFLGGIRRGRILHQEAVAMLLDQSFGSERVVVAVEDVEHIDEGQFILLRRFHRRAVRGIPPAAVRGDIAQPAHRCRIVAVLQARRQFQDGLFGHAVQQVIGLGIKQDGAADGIRPEIVMGNPAQGGFDPAQDDRTGVL